MATVKPLTKSVTSISNHIRTGSDCSTTSFNKAYPQLNMRTEKEGFNCGKCGARCPPTQGKFHNISSNLFIFYVDVSTDKNVFKVTCEADRNNCKARLESSIDTRVDKFITAIHTCNKYAACNYCVLCFQTYGTEIAKNEANNVCRYYNIACHPTVFTIE